MRILAANLKHLYQRRILWLYYVWAGSFAVAGASDHEAFGGPTGSLGWTVLLGAILGSSLRDVLSRSFSLLLPGHREAVPQLALVQCLLVGALVPVSWRGMALLDPEHCLTILAVAWLLGTACCLLGMVAGVALPYMIPVVCVPALLGVLGRLSASSESLGRLVVSHPAALSVGALALIGWVLWYLCRRHVVRRCMERPALSFVARPDCRRRTCPCETEPPPETDVSSGQAERLFGSPGGHVIPRPLWAVCYESLAAVPLPQTAKLGGLFVAIIGVMGYTSIEARFVVVSAFPAVMIVHLSAVHARSLLLLGRRQRRNVAFAEVAVAVLAVLSVAGAVMLISRALALLMPPLPLNGETLHFRPFPAHYILLYLPLVPPIVALRAWTKRPEILRFAAGFVVFCAAFLAAAGVGRGLLSPMKILQSFVVLLLVSAAALHYHCLHRDLV